MATSQPARHVFSSTLALWLALVGAGAMLYYHQGLFMPRVVAVRASLGLGAGYSFGNDFYQVWLSSRELLRRRQNPYSPEMTREIQTGLFGRPLDPRRPGDPVDRRVFPYPAYVDMLFWPTALFPFESVRVAVLFALIALEIAGVMMWLRALEWRSDWKWAAAIIALTLTSYSSLEALFAGQLGILVFALLAASVLALQRQRFLLAGILIALSTIKPQVTGLAICYLLLWTLSEWSVRKRFALGFLSTMCLLVGTSLLVLPDWIQSWVHTVLAYRHYTRPPLVTEILTSQLGPALSGPATVILSAGSIVVAAVVAWRNRAAQASSARWWLTVTLLLALTMIVALPGQAVYDHLSLLPGILVVVRYRARFAASGNVARILLAVGALVLFWPWMAALLLIVARAVGGARVFNSAIVFSLPLRMAGSLPFAILALLAWTLRINAVPKQESA